MPYRSAYLWVALLGLLTIPAFWRGYFSQLADAPFTLHFHAATSTIWLLLVAMQAWSAHRPKRLNLHRASGRASLYFFPILTVGFALIVWAMAWRTGNEDSIIYEMHGEGLGAYDLIASGALCWFYFEALKARRNVHVHARFMLGTMLLLIGPIMARIIMIPAFITLGEVYDPPTIFLWSLTSTQILLCLLTLALFWLAPIKGRRPAGIIAAVMLVLLAAFFLGRLSDGWREIFIAMGGTSPVIWAVVGFAAGSAASYFGWRAGSGATPAASEPDVAHSA